MKKTNIIANICFVLVLGILILTSCEPEPDNLGSQFLEENSANGKELSYDIIAYNSNNNDTIRSDSRNLINAIIGAFNDPVFGTQKASYVTQIRPSSYTTNFGTNPKVDSVVLQIIPDYVRDSVTTSTVTINNSSIDKGLKKTIKTYPLIKYGKGKLNGNPVKFTLKVTEVGDFLYDTSSQVYSNKVVNEVVKLGSKVIDGKVRGINITKVADNTEVLNRDPGIRVPLDASFFQQKIIAKQGLSVLSDVASFIRYFRGIRLSVDENDGFLFNINPNTMSITMYYSNDVTINGTTTRKQNTFIFDLGASNVHFSQFEFKRPTAYIAVMNNINTTKGDTRLYLQGTGGAGAEFIIPQYTIQTLKNIYSQNKAGILSAKIRLYSDSNIWNNTFAKPSSFVVLQKNMKQFMDDMIAFNSAFIQVKGNNLDKNPAYYDISITQTLRNIVEKGAENKPIVINVGDFIFNNQMGTYLGWNYNSRSYTPNRVVLIGSDPLNVKQKAQLKVIYTKK